MLCVFPVLTETEFSTFCRTVSQSFWALVWSRLIWVSDFSCWLQFHLQFSGGREKAMEGGDGGIREPRVDVQKSEALRLESNKVWFV